MENLVKIMKAADLVARWHVNQRRKGFAEEPYVNHLLEVASLVAEATDGSDPELIIASLLHDAIEDQEVPRDLIVKEFGERVAGFVCEVTDDKELSKVERKMRQVETSVSKSQAAKIIKLADKTSNVRAVGSSPASDWSIQRRLEYIAWSKNVVDGLRGASPWLEQLFDEACVASEKLIVG